MLQTTSYNFTHTSTTDEICVGVVKAAKLHQKRIRVDGATDGGPSHEEIQFLCTQHHIAKEIIVT